MARNPSKLGRSSEKLLRFIGRQQQNAGGRTRNTPLPDLKPKSKTSKLKRNKTLRGTA